MWLERISGGSGELISLDDARDHVRVFGDEHDASIRRAIASASSHLEIDAHGFGGLGFPILSQKWSSKANRFSADLLRLPFAYVTSVDEIRAISPNGQTSLVPASDYLLVRQGRETVVSLLTGKSWPDVADRPDAVDVRFTSGLAKDLSSVPEDIKGAARLLTGHFFDHREATITGVAQQEIEIGVERLIRPYRRFAM
ncbi:Phage gp6-like head-tail connector protein [Pseudovibrio sp. Ad5]|uniref:head-tail connector protein n=1 Tax=Pseudovibrio sp. Ad5 TaxID=989436 RepID=UPI0007AE64AF|nr:head-tail connector protein [Pseudovibrio sp. Ad5]KZK96334.1 Phage gp6-like head-tail connector protein [Pseudovibrio sp. Ad5]